MNNIFTHALDSSVAMSPATRTLSVQDKWLLVFQEEEL